PDMTKIAASRTRPASAILSCADDERETVAPSTAAEMVAMVGSPRVLGSGRQPHGLADGEIQRLLPILGAQVEALGDDELGLDADEVEDAAQIRLEMRERGRGRAGAVDSAARQRDDHALAVRQPLRAVRAVLEGPARNH